MSRINLNNEVISFTGDEAQEFKIDLSRKNKTIPNGSKRKLLQYFALYQGVVYIDLNPAEEETAQFDFSEDIGIPSNRKVHYSETEEIKKNINKKLSTVPTIIFASKLLQAQLFNNRNNFMQGLFNEDWKNHPVVINYLKHVDFLAYSSETLLVLYQKVIPGMIKTITALTKDEKHPELKPLLAKLEKERYTIQYAMLARINNAVMKNDLEDDDILFSVKENLDKANPQFQIELQQATKSTLSHSAPNKKMTEETWCKFNQILSTSPPDSTLRAEYKNVLGKIKINTPIRLKVFERTDSIIILPEGINEKDIPNNENPSRFRLGAYKRRTFFEKNQYRILELNNKIAEVKFQIENLKNPISLPTILKVIDQINELNTLIQDAISVADENKFGGIGKLFFQETNNMLEMWKGILFDVEKKDIFSIEVKLANKLLEQSTEVCWDEDHQLTPQALNKIYQFLYPLVGKLVKYNAPSFALSSLSFEEFSLLKRLVGRSFPNIEAIDTSTDYKMITFPYEEALAIKKELSGINTEEVKALSGKLMLHSLFEGIKSKTSVIYNKQNFISTFLSKFNEGEFKRNFIKDECNKIALENAVVFATQFTQDKDIKYALNFLCRIVNLNEEEIDLKSLNKEKIIKSLLPLFKTQKNPVELVLNLLNIVTDKYLRPITSDVQSNEYNLLVILHQEKAEKWRRDNLEEVNHAEEYLKSIFKKLPTSNEELRLAKDSIDTLQRLSCDSHRYLSNIVDDVIRPYLQTYQGENNILQSLFTHLGDKPLIEEYGKKLLMYYLQKGQYTQILNENFFKENKSILNEVFSEMLVEHLRQISNHIDFDFPDVVLEIIDKFHNAEEKNHPVLDELDVLRLKKLGNYISNPDELNKIFTQFSKSRLVFPASSVGIAGLVQFLKDPRVKWSEAFHNIIGKTKDDLLQNLVYVKWFETVVFDPKLALQYKPSITDYREDERVLKDFGRDNIPNMLQRIDVYLRNNKNITLDNLSVIEVFLSDRILHEFNRQDLKIVFGSVKRDLEFKMKVKNVFSELVQMSSNTSTMDTEVIGEINFQYERMERRKKSNDEEEANSIQQAIDEYFQWLIDKIIDSYTKIEEQIHCFQRLTALVSSVPSKYSSTLEILKKADVINLLSLKELFQLQMQVSRYLKEGILDLELNDTFILLLPLLSTQHLLKIQKILDLVCIDKDFKEGDPLQEVLKTLQKIVKQVHQGIPIKICEEEHNFITFYSYFKKIINTLTELSAQHEVNVDTIANEHFINAFNESPYSKDTYVPFWRAWLSHVNKLGHYEKVKWLNQKYLPEITSVGQEEIDVNPDLTYLNTLLQKLKTRNLSVSVEDNPEISKLWVEISSYTENAIHESLIPTYIQIFEIISLRLQKFQNIFIGYHLPDLKQLDRILSKENNSNELIYDFKFMNSYQAFSPQSFIDGILLQYLSESQKFSTKQKETIYLSHIDELIKVSANSVQKEIFNKIKNKNPLEQSLIDSMMNNYLKGLFNIQSLLLLDSIHHKKIITSQIWSIHKTSEDFPIEIRNKIFDQLFNTEVKIASSNLHRTTEIILECWSCIKNITQDKDVHPQVKKHVEDFIRQHQLEASLVNECSVNNVAKVF